MKTGATLFESQRYHYGVNNDIGKKNNSEWRSLLSRGNDEVVRTKGWHILLFGKESNSG